MGSFKFHESLMHHMRHREKQGICALKMYVNQRVLLYVFTVLGELMISKYPAVSPFVK